MADICVVHLVRALNGVAPFRDFIESYRAHGAGVPHDLLIIFKGFAESADLSEYQWLLQDITHSVLTVTDEGFDITAYSRAVQHTEHPFWFFLNSFSIILADGWLEKIYLYAQRADVGLTGATGSWMSLYSGVLHDQGKPSAYDRFLPPRKRRKTFELSEDLAAQIESLPSVRRIAMRLYYYGGASLYYRTVNSLKYYLEDRKRWAGITAANYEEFPTAHLRTNAFMIRRETFAQLQIGQIRTKNDAHRFESGKQSLSRQVWAMGLKVLVVGRNGRAYEKEEWPQSETFLQREQGNLLIADNQTRQYGEATSAAKAVWSRLAWGDKANADFSREEMVSSVALPEAGEI